MTKNNRQYEKLQQKLLRLREKYRINLPSRLAELEGFMARIDSGEQSSALYREFYQAIHRMAGSGTTFGYPKLSRQAMRIETRITGWGNEGIQAERKEIEEIGMEIKMLIKLAELPQEKLNRPFPMEQDCKRDIRSRLVYLVEDDDALAGEVKLQLQHFGFEVGMFCCAADAMDAVFRKPPDALVMDIMLPEGEFAGAEIVQRMRAAGMEKIPVLFTSIRTDYQARLLSVRAGGSAYLVKPLDVDVLVEQLDRLTHRQEQRPFRILLVDDDENLIGHLELLLQEAGMVTRAIQQPETLLDALYSLEPDLILLDLHLPECNGSELAGVIRQHDRFLGVPIVFVSTEANQDRQFAALDMGADEFLTKPIDDERLLQVVTTRAARARRLSELMSQDSLTGLLTHARLKERLEAEIKRHRRNDGMLSFAMIDLDYFKDINDRYGHIVGDRVIKSLAKMLKHRARQSDIVGRYGGEEFALILPDCELSDATTILDELRQDFARISHAGGEAESFYVTFSCGISVWKGGEIADELIRSADQALYRAKEQGRNCVVVN